MTEPHHFPNQGILHHYHLLLPCHLVWSKNLHIHFGWYNWPMNPFDMEGMLRQMNREILQRLHIFEKENPIVLDVGCGVGASALQLSALMPKAIFHGLNLSTEQVSLGQKMVHDSNLEGRVLLKEGDFQNMPYPTGFADAVFALESSCYAAGNDKALLVNELARMIKPGGKLVVVDGFRKHSRPFPDWLEHLYQKNLSLWAIDELADIRLFEKALSTAGFIKIQSKDISWKTVPTALHIPFIIAKLWWGFILNKKNNDLSKASLIYIKALALTMLLSIFRKHFRYYMVTAERAHKFVN